MRAFFIATIFLYNHADLPVQDINLRRNKAQTRIRSGYKKDPFRNRNGSFYIVTPYGVINLML